MDPTTDIINRKRELKGLPSSFSSILGRRISPPRPRNSTGGGTSRPRSVKSIVAWLELSAGSHADDASSKRSSQDLRMDCSIGSLLSSETTSQLTLHSAPEVECELTLLRYKQYFTETPLGRCLDEEFVHKPETASTAAGDIQGDGRDPEEARAF